MKSFIVHSNTVPKEKEIKFPVLAKRTNSELIVLFKAKKTGVVLVGNEFYSVGEYDETWKSVTDKDIWEILPNDYQLILQNDQ